MISAGVFFEENRTWRNLKSGSKLEPVGVLVIAPENEPESIGVIVINLEYAIKVRYVINLLSKDIRILRVI